MKGHPCFTCLYFPIKKRQKIKIKLKRYFCWWGWYWRACHRHVSTIAFLRLSQNETCAPIHRQHWSPQAPPVGSCPWESDGMGKQSKMHVHSRQLAPEENEQKESGVSKLSSFCQAHQLSKSLLTPKESRKWGNRKRLEMRSEWVSFLGNRSGWWITSPLKGNLRFKLANPLSPQIPG